MNNLREWRLLTNEIGSCKDNQRDLAQEVFAIQDFLRQEFGEKFNHFLKSRDLLDSESEEHELAEADNYPDEVTNNSDLAESDEEEIFEDESKQNPPDNYSEDTKNSDLAESDQEEIFEDESKQNHPDNYSEDTKNSDLAESDQEEIFEDESKQNPPDNYFEETKNSDLAESDQEEIFEDESKQNPPDNYSEETKNSDLAESDQEEIFEDEAEPDPADNYSEDTKDSDLDSTSLKSEQSWEDSSEYDEEEEREDVDVDIEIENLLKEDEFNLENFSDNDEFEELSNFSGRISRASSVCSDVHELIRQQLLQEFILGSNGKPKTQDEDKTLDVQEEEYENIYQKSPTPSPPSVPSPKRKKKRKRKKIAKHNDSENEDSKYQDQDQKSEDQIAESPIKEFPPPETTSSPPKEIIAPEIIAPEIIAPAINGESKDSLEKSLEESAAIAEENDYKAEVPVEVKAVDKTTISRLPVQATVEIHCVFCYFKTLRKEHLNQHVQAVHKSQWNDFLSQSSNTNDNVVEKGNEVSNCLT